MDEESNYKLPSNTSVPPFTHERVCPTNHLQQFNINRQIVASKEYSTQAIITSSAQRDASNVP